jgi:hypothetical protein
MSKITEMPTQANTTILNNNDRNLEFSSIIELYCISLSEFVKYVTQPTQLTTNIIQNKYIRSRNFDKYAHSVGQLNTTMHDIVLLIKTIIISLNKLFINKDVNDLTAFIEDLRGFLLFLIKENIFMCLNRFKDELDAKLDNDIKMINKIKKIKVLILRMVDLSIDLTTIFIPHLAFMKNVMEFNTSQENETPETIIQDNSDIYQMDIVINKLLDVQLRSQIILSGINSKNIFACLSDSRSGMILGLINKLQKEYVDLLQITIRLKVELEKYKKKRVGLVSRVLMILGAGIKS